MSADPMTRDLINADLRDRHDELMKRWHAALFDSCVALAIVRRETTFRALGFESFTAFAKSIHLSATTARRTANAGEIMELLRKQGHDKRIVNIDVMRPVLELATENQEADVRERVVKRQAQIIVAAIADADKCQEPFSVDVVARVARRFNILPRVEYQALKRQKQRDLWSPEERRKNALEALSQAIGTLAFYDDDVRGRKLERIELHIEELRALPGFDVALMMLIDARDA